MVISRTLLKMQNIQPHSRPVQVFQIIYMYVNIWEALGQKWWRINFYNHPPLFLLAFVCECYLNLTLMVKTTIIVLFCLAWNNFCFFWLTGVKCGYIISNQTNQDKAEVFLENKNVGKKNHRQLLKCACRD